MNLSQRNEVYTLKESVCVEGVCMCCGVIFGGKARPVGSAGESLMVEHCNVQTEYSTRQTLEVSIETSYWDKVKFISFAAHAAYL